MNKKLLIFFFVIALMPSLFILRGMYVVSDYHIVQCHWKSGSINKIVGDVFEFYDDISLENGEIIINGQSSARVILRQYRIYADNIIVIENSETSELGLYYEKGCD